MAEALLVFEDTIVAPDGSTWSARVCGRQAVDGRWEGWLEFDAIGADGARGERNISLHTGRETTQPKRADLLYWAGGLTHTFLEGALVRALGAHSDRTLARRVSGPGPGRPKRANPGRPRASYPGEWTTTTPPRGTPAPTGRPVLDPFQVYLQGEEVLRQELAALSPAHLRNIADAYRLEVTARARAEGAPALAREISAAVRASFSPLEDGAAGAGGSPGRVDAPGG